MGAGGIATGDEGVLALGDGGEGVHDGGGSSNTGGVSGGTAEDIVVVDKAGALGLEALDDAGEAVSNEGLLLALGVDQDQIGVAHLGVGDGLAGAGGVDLHGVAVLGLEHGQQLGEQAGIVDGGGGGQTDGLGFLGGSGDLTGVDRSILLDIEQVGAVLLHAVGTCHVQSGLGHQPLVQGIGTGGVQSNVGNGIAVGIDKGSLGVDGDDRVGVEHLVVGFLQNAGVNHQLSGGSSSLDGGGGFHGSGSLRRSSGLSGGGAAGGQGEDHGQSQQQGQQLFHISFLQNKKSTNRFHANRAQFPAPKLLWKEARPPLCKTMEPPRSGKRSSFRLLSYHKINKNSIGFIYLFSIICCMIGER